MTPDHWPLLFAGISTTTPPSLSPSAIWQVAWRAVLFYTLALIIIRMGKRRLMGRATAFDIALAFLFGSLLSRAINGSGPVLPTIVAAIILVVLHWSIGRATFRWPRLGFWFKGDPQSLIVDGKVQTEAMRQSEMSEDDLREALRLKAHLDDPAKVQAAYFERNGQISVLPRREPRILEIEVKEGVQTVRIEVV